MTAHTPDPEWDLLVENAERLGEDNPDSWQFSAHEVNLALTRLAALTADRDDARRELAEQKRINTSNLRVMTEQLDLARQTLADAPHEEGCMLGFHYEDATVGVCDCWKANL